MTVREVAEYLNIKERKVYDLVKKTAIPCSRVAGKWLFPLSMIDDWVAAGVSGAAGETAAPQSAPPGRMPPPVVAGSHDPLLEWCLRESACGLALMAGGSLDGLQRLADGEALVCGLHVLDAESGTYNQLAVRRALHGRNVVMIEWARRQQGLVTARGNPLGIRTIADLKHKLPRLISREETAGTHVLLMNLLDQNGLGEADLNRLPQVARSHTDIGLAILEGRADTGLAVAAVARQLQLDFVPLQEERYDLVIGHRDYFEAPFQKLLAFTRQEAFQNRAAELGYHIQNLGRVHLNLP